MKTICFIFSLIAAFCSFAEDPVSGAFLELRQRLSAANNDENRLVQRQEWDTWQASLLAPISTAEIARDQRESAATRVAEARRQSRQLGIDLDLLRQGALPLEAFCRDIPKGGMLHVHPSGTINKESLQELLVLTNPLINGTALMKTINERGFLLDSIERDFLGGLPQKSYSELSAVQQAKFRDLFFLARPVSFERFDSIFVLGAVLYQDEQKSMQVYRNIHELYLRSLQGHNVSYVELTAGLWPQVRPLLDSWSEDFKRDYGVTVRWNKSFARYKSAEENKDNAQEWVTYIKQHRPRAVVGIDLLANEKGNPALEKAQFIYTKRLRHNRDTGPTIRATQHAGELGHPMNPRDAMMMGSERIGHGVLLRNDLLAMEFARRQKVAVEVNLVSNKMLMALPDLGRHPFVHYARIGIPVVLSTDNDGIFQTNPSRECRTAVQNSDLTYVELKQMYLNSLIYSFAAKEDKRGLLAQLKENFQTFEETWRRNLGR